MSVTAKAIIPAQFALSAGSTLYTAPNSARTIIDKCTVTNTDVGAQTVTVNLVPSGGAQAQANAIAWNFSIAAGAIKDFTEIQNHVLNAGDSIFVKASVDSKLVTRASGREVQ